MNTNDKLKYFVKKCHKATFAVETLEIVSYSFVCGCMPLRVRTVHIISASKTLNTLCTELVLKKFQVTLFYFILFCPINDAVHYLLHCE